MVKGGTYYNILRTTNIESIWKYVMEGEWGLIPYDIEIFLEWYNL